MRLNLVHSAEHVCCNKTMIWQPAARSYYCATDKCHRREAPNEYGGTPPKPVLAGDFYDKPPKRTA